VGDAGCGRTRAVLERCATAVVLTPAVYAATRRARAKPLSYLFISVVVTYAVLRRTQHRNLQGGIERDVDLPALKLGGVHRERGIVATGIQCEAVFRSIGRRSLPCDHSCLRSMNPVSYRGPVAVSYDARMTTKATRADVRAPLLGALLVMVLSACAPSSHVLVGTTRPPMSPTLVKVYLQPPAVFQEIAVLNASADSMFGNGGQAKVNKVIERLKEEAAKLGANGIILEGLSDREVAALGGGTGSTSYSGNTAVGVGVGGSFGIFKKTGHARAIVVPEASTPPPANAPSVSTPP
jgi:hypothetical protein